MSSKEEEYKEMFLDEAIESYEEINQLFTQLEKDNSNQNAINAIFRITHTLKGNAMGLGFDAIAELSHIMEDVFSEVKQKNSLLDSDLFNTLFKANDKLGELIQSLKTGKKVNYKGIRTKLSVYLHKIKNNIHESNLTIDNQKNDVEIIIIPSQNQILNTSEESSGHQLISDKSLNKSNSEKEANQISFLEDATPKITLSDLVQVPIRKLDSLLNLVGELMIERDGLISKSQDKKGLNLNSFTRLQRITSDLQYGIMDVRLVQIGFLFNKFHRTIRDVASIENKKVNLVLEGTEIEIDRTVLKIMSDSLIHVIRNSVCHGIESPKNRIEKGKQEEGRVILKASNEKDKIIIEVIDDGNGIDHLVIGKNALKKGLISKEYYNKASKEDLLMLIFEPGFSSAEQITEVSGRGVGMDVVKRSAESIGGKVEVKTEIGVGTTISLHLPSSMAVKGALLFELQEQEYAVALTYTEAVIRITKKELHKINNGLMISYLDKPIPIFFLKDLFEVDSLSDFNSKRNYTNSLNTISDLEKKLDVLVVSYANKYCGIIVDKFLQQKEIVEKTLSPPIDKLEIVSGVTILGNGNVCLVLDISNIMNTIFKEKKIHAYGS
jgi:two-component system chemotaxis sensor kinase CheA